MVNQATLDITRIVFRFLITFIASFLIGMERQRAHKSIGFGAIVFVAIGSCGLAITAVYLNPENPLPLLSAIVTGIGFLGAGALIRSNEKIFGFTTAASIWTIAIFGLLIGVGEYLVGMFVYILMWLVVVYDTHLEKHGIGLYQKKITIKSSKIIDDKEIKNHFLMFTKRYKLIEVDIDKINNKVTLTFLVEGTKENINRFAQKLFEKDWLESCKVE